MKQNNSKDNTNDTASSLNCPAFDLPESKLLSQATQDALARYRDNQHCLIEELAGDAASIADLSIDEQRQLEIERFHRGRLYQQLTERYEARVEKARIGGVLTETFTPMSAIAPENANRILINLHGGSFESGSQTNSQLESMPVAALGQIKVISVDYRMAPAHRFPAATDDVVAVYKVLLENYRAENIGLYGSSSGAILAAQTLVRLQQEQLPLPAALGLIAGGATTIDVGDSVAIGASLAQAAHGYNLADALKLRYYEGAKLDNPELTPALSDAYMSTFPPTLLASSSRDFFLSSVLATHRQLIRLGVDATLHVWEGLDHVFHYNPELPETTELHQLTQQFFQQYLGRESK